MPILGKRIVREIIEESILQLAKDYQGNGAFFFHNEADANCRLYSIIQTNLKDPQLVHSEWGEDKPYGFYDLVIWRPTKKAKAFNCWGDSHKELMKKVPELLLVAIEIDCLYGSCGKANHFTTYKELEGNQDIQKLKINIGKTFPYGYFLLLWDEEAAEKYSLEVNKINQKCKGLFDKYRIRSICISREKKNILFKHGFVK